ncbi:ABC transporter ATP-binding protein [Brevibacillus fluminis]|uniref:ABC transporter ATP-binding protein n=1 Tax=Brevibacillus fluminis TaxID=511487 RepID=A0A3M8CWJ0_9BACL|nr:ABC transporter ATP-binding protein [Brevibacillus fluminis]RNB79195.1 ABC transporter ATP-binding protein [Brevibacillus fluminis]
MGYLRKYASKYGGRFLLAVLFVTMEALADLLLPTIMSQIIDVGIVQQRTDYVLKMGSLMLLITAGSAVMASGRNFISSIVSQRFGNELRADLYRKILSLPFESMDKLDRASLVTRLTNDVTQVQNFANGLMRIFVKSPIICIGSLIMATRLNPHLATVLAIVVPVVAILIAFNMKVGFPRFLKVQAALDQLNRVTREYLSGVRVVKAFNRFDYEVQKFAGYNEEFRSRSVNSMRVMNVFSPAIMLTVNFGIIAILWMGALRLDSGQMQVGHIVAFINYMTQILFSLMVISMVFTMFVRARASAGRIGEVFAQHASDRTEGSVQASSSEDGTRGRIDFQNVSFAYADSPESPVVRNVSFTCLPGQTIGLIGSTGSGKSSLISLIPRFYKASEGRILVDGVDVAQMDTGSLRDKIAVVPQKTILFTGTVTENIRWGKEDATEAEIRQAAEIAEAHPFIASSSEGYQTRIGQGGVNFSGGQKQRLSIARALVRKPDILILDDCTSALDATTEVRIKSALKTYAKGLTCIMIAQRITSVIDADKIIVLDQGQVVGMGTHEELLKACTVYKEIYRSQIGREVS